MDRKRILVVEDNLDSYELMRFALERSGYETFLAVNGLEGVNAARQRVPDLIIMDLSMPIMDGWTATSLIREDKKTFMIPVIAVTAYSQPGDRVRALNMGCNEYVTKPMNLTDLVATVGSWVSKGKIL